MIKIFDFRNGMTVRDLKRVIDGWSVVDHNGDDCEVWIETGRGLVSQVRHVIPLNVKNEKDTKSSNILLET